MDGIPDKSFYKIGEVCQYTDTQPYVLRFWESEFPQLAPEKNRSGQRVYTRRDIELVLKIKKLLYEEEFTIAGARKRLEMDESGEQGGRAEPAPRKAGARSRTTAHEERGAPAPARDEKPALWDDERTAPGDEARAPAAADDSVEYRSEIEVLRERVRELEARSVAAESALDEAREAAEQRQARARKVADRLEVLLDTLGRPSRPDLG